MPNHVTNIISFSGAKEDINDLLNQVKNDEQIFSLNKIIPQPDELSGLSSPAEIVTENEYKKWKEEKANGSLDTFKLSNQPITMRISNELIKKFGYDNWYDWRVCNWGTKWDVYDIVDNGDGTIQFNTAWSSPINALVRLSELYPKVEINLKFADEDIGHNVGEVTLVNGEIEESNIPKDELDCVRMALMIIHGDSINEAYELNDYLIDNSELNDYTNNLIKLVHEFGILNEDYPNAVLKELQILAIREQQYERANKIKKLLANSSDE